MGENTQWEVIQGGGIQKRGSIYTGSQEIELRHMCRKAMDGMNRLSRIPQMACAFLIQNSN